VRISDVFVEKISSLTLNTAAAEIDDGSVEDEVRALDHLGVNDRSNPVGLRRPVHYEQQGG
jgi:hypothetical protein